MRPQRELGALNKHKSIIDLHKEIIIIGVIKLKGKYRYFRSIIAKGIKKLTMIIEKIILIDS